MMFSFFEVDVCSLAGTESKLNPEGKRRTARGDGGRAFGPHWHRFTRDSFAGAACAGPKASERRPAPRAKTCARRQFRGREARTRAILAVKNSTCRIDGRNGHVSCHVPRAVTVC